MIFPIPFFSWVERGGETEGKGEKGGGREGKGVFLSTLQPIRNRGGRKKEKEGREEKGGKRVSLFLLYLRLKP